MCSCFSKRKSPKLSSKSLTTIWNEKTIPNAWPIQGLRSISHRFVHIHMVNLLILICLQEDKCFSLLNSWKNPPGKREGASNYFKILKTSISSRLMSFDNTTRDLSKIQIISCLKVTKSTSNRILSTNTVFIHWSKKISKPVMSMFTKYCIKFFMKKSA